MEKYYIRDYCSLCSSICQQKETLESLQTELNSIKRDMDTIKKMEISDQAKVIPLLELENKINEVKEKMHNLVDKL